MRSPTSPLNPSTAARSARLALGAVAAAAAAHALSYLGYLVDDAYISFRYGRNLARGLGLVFNPGERVEGFTNLSWTLLSALFEALGVRPSAAIPLVSLGLGALLFARVVRRARRSDDAPWAGVAAGAVLAASGGLACYAVTGLETVCFATLVFLAVEAALDARPWRFAALTALAFTTRPEAAVLGLGVVGYWAARALWLRDARARSLALRATLLLAPTVGAFLAWRRGYYGEWVPNTFYAKPRFLPGALRYAADHALPLLALGAAPLIAGIRPGALRREERAALAALVVGSLAQVFEGADWMPLNRLLVPLVPFAALGCDRGLRALGDRAVPPARRLAVAAVTLGALAMWASSERTTPWYFERMAVSSATRRELARRIHQAGFRSLALLDIGEIGYALPDVTITDLGALTDRELARTAGLLHGKAPTVAWLRRRAPEVVLLNSREAVEVHPSGRAWRLRAMHDVENALLHLPAFREGYRYACAVRTDYQINVLVRRDLDPRALVDGRFCAPLVRPR